MGYRKLGRPTDQRKAMLRGLVTALLHHGSIVTTVTRAKEVQSIAEKLIAAAVKEADNFTTKQATVSRVKVDSKGKPITTVVKSKNGREYRVREREITTELVRVDNPSRLAARRKAIAWIYQPKDEEGNKINVVNKLFDEIAVKYKGKTGGYTRIYKLDARRGDGSVMAKLELI
ncbi:MAG: 50S ribosomal protein L17 [Clostridiaceae bacterium]|nr:50S ribosomal protein L17 [Clostridiaceae bacterium]HOA32848.1 L17 family ribosomal protein [Clostridia bacterium]